ncbi:MAG: hypothetical protein P4L53_02580 [Candidatus Obscuribacterales bacterium]|nr:hypothetical protein [Candidatus Obscuribacterales bacterium]
MNFDIKSGLSKLTLSCLVLTAVSTSAHAQNAHKYQTPLDIELLDSAPVVNNLRQRSTVEHMIIHVGHSEAGLDPQPEMICPTAKSPTIQEWPSQSTKIYATRPVAVISQHAPVKVQSASHQSFTAIKSKPVPIASAYPFYTGSSSYTTGGKISAQYK